MLLTDDLMISENRTPLRLSILAAAAALFTSIYSLLNRSVYSPSTPAELLPGAVSQDTVTVAAAAGVLVCVFLIRRKIEKAWLPWAGFLGYLFYAYGLYSFDRVYNELFLLYVAILGLSVYSLITFFMKADPDKIRCNPEKEPPRRSAAILLILLAGMFLFLWLSILIPHMTERTAPDGNAIFVLDLSFFLPLLVTESILLLRRKPLGDLLAVPVLVKLGTLGISVLLGALISPFFGLELEPGSVVVYSILGLGPLFLSFPFILRLRISGFC
jgi:hypothetical protein